MNMIYEKIKDKRIVIFGVGIIQADLLGIFEFKNLQYYVCDMVETTGDVMLEDMPCYHSNKLLEEDRENLYIIICENDESYASRRLEEMGFEEGNQFCFAEDILFEYAHGKVLPKITRVWGVGGTLSYHQEELEAYLGHVRSHIVSDMQGIETTYNGLPVSSFREYRGEEDEFILVCSIYYKDIGRQLLQRGLKIGKDFMNVRTFVKLIKYAAFSDTKYTFINRSRNAKNLLIVLSGYKPFVWESVFGRLKAYTPSDFDVLVMTSGKDSLEMRELCEKYNWSYVSTERNNVSMVLNLGISLFPEAHYIWKIDEDIIVTKNCFERMQETYQYLEKQTRYEVGFVSPILNVNGYGYVPLLEHLNLTNEWENKFGELRVTDCYTHHVAIHDAPEAALFMWGNECKELRNIDEISGKLDAMNFQYSICPVRYSIGFIMFSRQNWIRMEMFPVTSKQNLGADEEHLCKFCLMHARVMAVAENTIAGHLSYGPQHKVMEDYYKKNENLFLLRDK